MAAQVAAMLAELTKVNARRGRTLPRFRREKAAKDTHGLRGA
jgi:hypothetical protein